MEEDTDEVDDIEEHIDPVNILSQLNKNFFEKLEAKKWQERKEAIDMLEGILSKALKIESGEYGDLVRALKKVRNYILLLFILNTCVILFLNVFISKIKTNQIIIYGLNVLQQIIFYCFNFLDNYKRFKCCNSWNCYQMYDYVS